MEAYCRWYGKEMKDVTEHEQQQCEENGQNCALCPDRVDKENESEKNQKTPQGFEESGECKGCYFYENIIGIGQRVCVFPWDDDDAIEWELARNCSEIRDL